MSEEEIRGWFGRMTVRFNPPFTPFHREIVYVNVLSVDPPQSVIMLDCGHIAHAVGYLHRALNGRVFCPRCKVAAN